MDILLHLHQCTWVRKPVDLPNYKILIRLCTEKFSIKLLARTPAGYYLEIIISVYLRVDILSIKYTVYLRADMSVASVCQRVDTPYSSLQVRTLIDNYNKFKGRVDPNILPVGRMSKRVRSSPGGENPAPKERKESEFTHLEEQVQTTGMRG